MFSIFLPIELNGGKVIDIRKGDVDMADKADQKKDEKDEKPKFTYTEDQIKKAAELIDKQGYVTKKDIPEMKNDDWTKGFSAKVDEHLHQDENEHPYLYFEKFDFIGGEIDCIIWNMDVIKTREDALHKLADVLNKKVNENTPQQFQQKTY